MGAMDFKNRIVVYGKVMCFLKDEISPLHYISVEMTYSLIIYKQNIVTSTVAERSNRVEK